MMLEILLEKYPRKPWEWGGDGLSKNPSITPKIVERYLDKPWVWGAGGLSSNPGITPQFIEKYIDKPWFWGKGGLSSNPSITPQFVERHLEKMWHWGKGGLTNNPAITEEFVERHIEKPWDWGEGGLRSNLSIRFDFVKTRLTRWGWGFGVPVLKHSNSWKFGTSHSSFSANNRQELKRIYYWRDKSMDPSVTLGFIEQHEDAMLWSHLSRNTFSVSTVTKKKIEGALEKLRQDETCLFSALSRDVIFSCVLPFVV